MRLRRFYPVDKEKRDFSQKKLGVFIELVIIEQE